MSAAERMDCLVIGAGVVGLATARALARAGRDVIVVEKNARFGEETSSRNSEVIHAGIYYPPGSLKSRLCVRGKALLYEYCGARAIAHARCEKLIVATRTGEESALERLRANAEANGVDDLVALTGAEARVLEPEVYCTAALRSPSTGIVDSHGLMTALLGEIEDAGGVLALETPVARGAAVPGGVRIETGGVEPAVVEARLVVNAAGLWASGIAGAIEGMPAEHIPHTRYAKGRYFAYTGRAPFSRLIYPMPTPDSQGAHYTRDLGGQGRLGPDIVWDVALGDYAVEPEARAKFFADARAFWPGLEEDRLHASYAGLRPKIGPPGETHDFRIDGPEVHGVGGLINLFGIESPGLTASLAIGEHVAALARAL